MNEHESKRELATEAFFLAMERVEGLVEKGRQEYFDKAGIDPLPLTQPDEELGDVLAPAAMLWMRLFDDKRTEEECDEIIVHAAYVSALRDAQKARKKDVIAQLKDADLKIYSLPG